MREQPEIAPEIRGLLEELVADPRSSIRLVPRKPLSSWFDSDETVRPREVSGTRLERHLIEAHREELALLLLEASEIAQWKAPVLSHLPLGRDGRPCDPSSVEETWKPRAARASQGANRDACTALLRMCLGEVHPREAPALAQASLGLVPSNRARFYSAAFLPIDRPRSAISLLRRLADHVPARNFRAKILASVAARLCVIGNLSEARESYQESSALDPNEVLAKINSFNLSCFLGDEQSALSDAAEIERRLDGRLQRVFEASAFFREWKGTQGDRSVKNAARVVARIADQVGDPASLLCQAVMA